MSRTVGGLLQSDRRETVGTWTGVAVREADRGGDWEVIQEAKQAARRRRAEGRGQRCPKNNAEDQICRVGGDHLGFVTRSSSIPPTHAFNQKTVNRFSLPVQFLSLW